MIATDCDMRYHPQFDVGYGGPKAKFVFRAAVCSVVTVPRCKKKEEKKCAFTLSKALYVSVQITHQWLHLTGLHRKVIHSST